MKPHPTRCATGSDSAPGAVSTAVLSCDGSSPTAGGRPGGAAGMLSTCRGMSGNALPPTAVITVCIRLADQLGLSLLRRNAAAPGSAVLRGAEADKVGADLPE